MPHDKSCLVGLFINHLPNAACNIVARCDQQIPAILVVDDDDDDDDGDDNDNDDDDDDDDDDNDGDDCCHCYF